MFNPRHSLFPGKYDSDLAVTWEYYPRPGFNWVECTSASGLLFDFKDIDTRYCDVYRIEGFSPNFLKKRTVFLFYLSL